MTKFLTAFLLISTIATATASATGAASVAAFPPASATGAASVAAFPPTSAAQAPTADTTAQAAPTPALLEPAGNGTPHTEMLDPSKTDTHDPLLEPKPLPPANLSLIGGIVRKVDAVRSRIIVQPFGGGNRYQIYLDERTRILSAGRETTVLAIHPGDRIYVDTQAVGAQVFAKSIQVRTVNGPASASGQIIEVLGATVKMLDRSSGETVRFAVNDRTRIESQRGPTTSASLHTGSLIDVTFTSAGHRGEAQSIIIHATPGESYVFTGILTDVNIREGVLALDNQVDGNNYELYFDPLQEKNLTAQLVAGTPIWVSANFDGKRYRATSIKITEPAVQP